MEAKVEQTPVTNVNPVLSVDKNGCVLYSNEAGNLLLKDWGMTIGEKVPSHIGDIVQRVISLNSPEKIEVKAGSKAYFVVFSPLPEHEYVNISGFDISDQKELEEKLWESEARFSAFMDNNPANAWMKNEQGEYIFLNKTSLDKIGIWHENWLGKTDHEIFPQDIAGLLCENDREVLTSNKTIAVEEETVNPDGRCIHWLGFKFPFKDASGKRYVGGIAVDITQRKQAEEALKKLSGTLEEKVKERTAELEKAYNSLKESEKRLAEAQRMAHIGDWEWDIKTDSAYWSDEMYRIFERDPLKLAPPYNEFLNYLHSDDREYAYNAHKEALNAETFSMDHRIILPNGKERTIHMKTEVIFNENSIPIRLKGTVQDITERKEVEEKLRESEEKYRNIVETANEGIGLIDNELKLTYVNKKIEEMIGYSSEEIIGKSIWDFISEDSKPIVKSILDRGLRDFENPELKYIRKDGSHFWAQVNAKPIFDIDGKFMGILTMIADITKRKEAEETLTNFENARKKEIHHRIKNNLQVIYSLLDLQSEKFRNRECIDNYEVLDALRESQDRVISMALIHEELYRGGGFDTLNFSRYINELVDNLFLTYRLGSEGISLDMNIDKDIFFDMDTAVPLGIIINELVSNSLKHAFKSRDKGEIQIKLHREECKSTSYALTVSDNGIGIPKDFDIEDLDSLGLQLITTLVDQLDGELELKRDNGTEFIIRFSVTEKNDQEQDPSKLQFAENN